MEELDLKELFNIFWSKKIPIILLVLIFAVLTPLVTIGIIISNVSQQSVRSELANNTSLMAHYVGDAIESYVNLSQAQLNQMASGFNYIPDTMSKIQYFDDIEAKTKLFKRLDIVKKNQIPKQKYNIENGMMTLISPIDPEKNYYLSAQINLDIFNSLLGKENIKGRNIFVFDYKTKELIVTNANDYHADNILSGFNIDTVDDVGFFGKKNTPKAFYKIDNPTWVVVVDTTQKITAKTINKARYRIITSIGIAALSIIIIVSLYTYYLYINIRQLFKGITAISKGNYDKKIHLIKSLFTPYETIFIAKEFNYMANKIKISYRDLKEKNKELEKLNEFRENLVNATSHEFRTPLTSIIGYTSRLLRHDIQVDEQTRIKSLQIIKQQAQRLSGMVEDLLVIPELESYSLKFNIQEVDLADSISRGLEYLNNEEIEFQADIAPDLNYVYADDYRLEQIIINLVDNAMKYSLNKAPVKIRAYNDSLMPVVEIINKCEKISPEIKEKLFEKFIRVDSNLTRTTRGTGLGLYIVKGLAEAMKIDINLDVDDEFKITLKFNDYVK